jgi:hypothetical protein
MHATVTFRRQALESVGGYDVSPRHAKITTVYLRITRRFPAHQHDGWWRNIECTPSKCTMMLKTTRRVLWLSANSFEETVSMSKLSRTGIKYFEECFGKRIISRIKEDWRSPAGRKTS